MPSQALLVTMDYSSLPVTPVWTNSHLWTYSGFGADTVWGSWNMDLTSINSTNPAAYIFACDTRAFGMANAAPVTFYLIFETYDGTLSDPDGNPDILLQAEYTTQVSSNFTHIQASLDDDNMRITAGSLQTLYDYAFWMSDLRIEVKGDPAVPSFGTDAENGFIVDNFVFGSTYAPPPPPTVPMTILEWNMDDKPLWYTYGGYNWSANAFLPAFTYPTNLTDMAGYGVDGSSGWWLQMDNSALAAPNTPAYAGGGTGGGGPVDFTLFTDNILKHYVLECDARAEDLAPDVTNATLDCQLFMDSPQGNVRLDFTVPASSNWVHSAFDFNSAIWDTGEGRLPKASFSTNYNTYTDLHTQWQISNAAEGRPGVLTVTTGWSWIT